MPADVLDGLQAVASTDLPLNVLAAARFSVKAAGIETIQLGKSGFLHKSVPGRLVGRIHGARKEPFHANDFPWQGLVLHRSRGLKPPGSLSR